MREKSAEVVWRLAEGEVFAAGRYSRRHQWRFDGGAEVLASSSPTVVPPPWSDPACVDPEEAFLAAISSCHMLWFLFLAEKSGITVKHDRDNSSGGMTPNERGKLWMSIVTLRPEVDFGDAAPPDVSTLRQLHERAHEHCFIANSVRSEIRVEPMRK